MNNVCNADTRCRNGIELLDDIQNLLKMDDDDRRNLSAESLAPLFVCFVFGTKGLPPKSFISN